MMRSLLLGAAALVFVACHKPSIHPDSDREPEAAQAEPVDVPAVTAHAHAALLATPTIVFTAGVHGYTEPCGCTQDLVLGGIDRVVATALSVQRAVPASLMLDAGGLLFEHETLSDADRAQELRKTEVILAAAQAMHVQATVPAPSDLANGLEFYLEAVSDAEIEVLAANLTTTDGLSIGVPDARYPLGDATVHVIGVTSSDAFAAHNTLVSTPPLEAITSLLSDDDVTVVLFQGDIADARRDLAELSGVDFVVIGQPRHTDEIETIGSAQTVEAYDQGRTIGRLALFGLGTDGPFVNARPGSTEEIARLERIMEGIETQLAQLPATPEGEAPPPIVVRQQERLASLAAERDAMASGELQVPESGPGFYYEPIPMDLDIPGDPMIHAEMMAFNSELREINLSAPSLEIAPVPEGQAHYVGDQECAQCHFEEMAAWQQSVHAHAYATLEERDKAFDRSCIGCHVTAFEVPGGSTLADLRGLENVQCEQCHGAGSEHIINPMATRNTPNGVHAEVPVTTCQGCHNAIHSPTFDDTTYRPHLIVPGHGLPRE